mgnify:CR=1 FL=1
MGKNTSDCKRIWRVEPPEEVWSQSTTGKVRWTPERLTLREGIRQTAVPVLIGYCLLIAGNVWNFVRTLVLLPPVFALPVHFGLSDMQIHGIVFAVAMVAIQMYLIYRELIRKVFTKTLLLIPAMYFVIETTAVAQVLQASGS